MSNVPEAAGYCLQDDFWESKGISWGLGGSRGFWEEDMLLEMMQTCRGKKDSKRGCGI